jgi:hypothetical protein
MEGRRIGRIIGLGLFVLVLVAVGAVILASRKERPVLSISVYRGCDFVDLAGEVWAICDDGTRWKVTEKQPTVTPSTPTSYDVPEPSKAFGETVQIHYSHYYPPLGGTNCGQFVNGKCISKMASGKPWGDYIGEAVACPKEWPFGTLVLLDGQIWTCLDRGSAVRYVDGMPWLDFLTERGAYPYGTIVPVQVIPAS